jgi:hypothetical protein
MAAYRAAIGTFLVIFAHRLLAAEAATAVDLA